jgi:hypothetical protein
LFEDWGDVAVADALDAALERMTDRLCASIDRWGKTIARSVAAAIPGGQLVVPEDHENVAAAVVEDVAGAESENVGVSLSSSPAALPLESLVLTRWTTGRVRRPGPTPVMPPIQDLFEGLHI